MSDLSRLRLAAFASLLCLAAAAHAATPASGTLSTSQASLSFTGGPFLVPNETDTPYDNLGSPNPVCQSPGVDCDKFALTVDLPADYGTTHPNAQVAIKTSWPTVTGAGPVADACFADYLLDSSGTIVNAAYTCGNPEVMMAVAGQGTQQYTVEIIPELPLGQSYTTTVELTDGASAGSGGASNSAPPPPNGVPPKPLAFAQYTAPSGLGDNAGEPSIGVDPNPNVASLKHDQVNAAGVVFFQSGPNTLRANFDDGTVPATATWDDVSTRLVQQFALSDPIGFVDRQTGRVFSLDLIGGEGQSFMAFSDDDGATWTPAEGGPPAGSPDHETLASGPYAPPLAGLGPVYPNAVYYCGQPLAGTNFCARSDDGGLTFGPQIPTLHAPDCTPVGAQNGHVKVGPDGTVYLPQGRCPNDGLLSPTVAAVSISQDNGLTWTFSSVPDSTESDLDPAVAIDAGNNVYLTWPDANHHPHVAVSTDHGKTWSHDTDVGAPLGINNADFVIATAGDAGRAAVGFIGTPTTGDSRSASAINTVRGAWHLYIAVTYDGGKTWTTVDATPHDPVQVGSVCTSGTTCGADRNLLDFNDLQIDTEGRILAGFADGCLAPGCNEATSATTKPPYNASRASKAAIVRQACGLGLLSAYDAKLGSVACATTVPGAPAIPAGASCHVPGVELITDGAGDALPDQGSLDITAIDVAEPADMPGKLVFTMKVADLGTVPPGTRWVIRFLTDTPPANGDDTYFVEMTTAPTDFTTAQGTATTQFVYGSTGAPSAAGQSVPVRLFNVQGDLDPASKMSADGTITLVLDESKIPSLTVGKLVTGIAGTTRAPATPDNQLIYDQTGNGVYLLAGTAACSGAKAASSHGVVLGGGLGWLTLLPLGIAGVVRRRRTA